ncbi:hypothetical protein N0V88_003902 [Collariella sp. IMI 366227]|nr:hypothetical protein N0V88_003902 [Collariella sp. IMI 366227]
MGRPVQKRRSTLLLDKAPPKERERDPDDDGRAETTELAALLQPIIVNNPAPSGGEGLEEPVGVPHDDDNHPIAPPPSPASNARARAGAAGLEAFFKIWPSKLGGLGAFAVRELRRGQTILVERPLLRTTHFRLLPDFHKLSEGAKTAFLGLHGGEGGDPFGRVERIQRLNSFLFETSNIVPAGTELRLSYGGSPVELYANFGFRCYCGGCTPLTDEEVNLLDGKGHDVVGDW